MSTLQRISAFVVGTLAIIAIAAASRIPISLGTGTDALVRLSWRVDGIIMEECRQLTDEELEKLPVHMRNENACIGRIAPYHLQVGLEETRLVDDTIYPGGARGDRPIYVLHDIPVTPGRHRVRIRFEPILPVGAPPGIGGIPLYMDTVVTVRATQIVLVTTDENATDLVIR
ncbi:MAG: hypothetical protein OEZ65_03090 [Gemmatimonadota bacterium]|nr:hypothetical protein [Gemmatimonadota bacterium]MDH5758548.1 hypothetical protein [Gemmatimonadota bacterium]